MTTTSARAAPANAAPSPTDQPKYAIHRVRYQTDMYPIPVKLTDERGKILYANGARIPPELITKIEEVTQAMLQCAEKDGVFSRENPITSLRFQATGSKFQGICTKDGQSRRRGETAEWKAFTATVGWDRNTPSLPQRGPPNETAQSRIAYPSKPIPTIKGSECVFFRETQIDPLNLTEPTGAKVTPEEVLRSYNQLPVAVKLRFLNTLLDDPYVKGRGIYRVLRDRLGENTAINQEIKRLKQQLPEKPLLADADKKLIDSLYVEFSQRAPAGPVTEKMIRSIKEIMREKPPLPNIETLIEYYQAICKIKGDPVPTFASDHETFSTYWLSDGVNHLEGVNHLTNVTNFVEAMVFWADLEGASLEMGLPRAATAENAQPSNPLPLLDKTPKRYAVQKKEKERELTIFSLAKVIAAGLAIPVVAERCGLLSDAEKTFFLAVFALVMICQGITAVYNYGPIERTKRAVGVK